LSALVAVFAAIMLLPSCSRFKDVTITSCDIVSLSPNGLKSVDVVLNVGVHNPASSFTVQDLKGTIHEADKVLAEFSAEPVTVGKKCDRVYEVRGSVTIVGKISFFDVMELLQTRDFSRFLFDADADVKLANGPHRKLTLKDNPVTSIDL